MRPATVASAFFVALLALWGVMSGRWSVVLLPSPSDVVILPASLPFMKQGWAFAWRSLMAAEIYVTMLPGFGLGTCCITDANSTRWIR
jgi:ABC-type nitrate/sulfonate/bicarbonate transport system permease component